MIRRNLIASGFLLLACCPIPTEASLPSIGQLSIPSDHRVTLELIGKRDALDHIATASRCELHVSVGGSLGRPIEVILSLIDGQAFINATSADRNVGGTSKISFEPALAERIRKLIVMEFRRAGSRIPRGKNLILFDTDTLTYTLETDNLRCVAIVDDIHDYESRIGRLNALIRMLAAYCEAAADERVGRLGHIDHTTTELEIANRYLAESTRR